MAVIIKALDKELINNSIPYCEISNAALVPENKALDSLESPNYLSFDGKGLDLVNDNKKFFENGDYSGILGNENLSVEIYYGENFKKIALEFYDNSCTGFTLYYSNAQTQMTWYGEIEVKQGIAVIDMSELGSPRIRLERFVPRYPEQKVKIASISFGGISYFTKAKNVNVLEEINILSDDLPINTFSADIVADGDFTPKYDMPIAVYSNYKYYGEFYISEFERTSEYGYSITANNAIGKLENTNYDRYFGVSRNATYTIEELIRIANVEIESGNISDCLIWGSLPGNTSRYALCSLAFACGMMINSSRDQAIHLCPIPSKITSIIGNDRIIGEATLRKNTPILNAEYNYYKNQEVKSNILEIKQAVVAGNREKITFSNPTVVFSDNDKFEVKDRSNYFLDFIPKITSDELVMTATEVPLTTLSETVVNPFVTSGETKTYKELLLRGYTLGENGEIIDIDRSDDILKFIQSKGVVSGKIVLKNEKVGDLVQIKTAWDGVITGIITSLNISFGYDDIADIEVTEWSL